MSKTAAGLVEFCKGKIGTSYVYGAKGEVLTQAVLDRLARESPGMFTPGYKAKARKCIGKVCVDCSGLISWYTGIERGSYNYHDTAVKRVPIAKLDESMAGWAVWKPGNIGVYIGGGYCIEAKGIDYGTIKSKVTATPWQKALKLRDIDYTVAAPVPVKKSGWQQEDGGCRYYNGDIGEPVRNNWVEDKTAGKWYWFDGAGMMVASKWYQYKHAWYYLGADGAMATGQQTIDGKWYVLDDVGRMVTEPVTLAPDQDGRCGGRSDS